MNFNIPFMSYRRFATIGSLVLLIMSIGSLSFKGLNLGLDFSGGTLIEVSYSEAADLGDIRDLMTCLLYTSPSPRDGLLSRMPSSA